MTEFINYTVSIKEVTLYVRITTNLLSLYMVSLQHFNVRIVLRKPVHYIYNLRMY